MIEWWYLPVWERSFHLYFVQEAGNAWKDVPPAE